MTEVVEMPMFPLGTVLFPTQPLPLRVFEPRYQQMTLDLVNGDGRFGVTLIERGYEVGGGDVRSSLGCVAQLVQARQTAPGRYALFAIGTQRLLVHEWLPDDPYPRARVELLDEPDGAAGAGPALDAAYAEAQRLVRRALALVSELGYGAGPVPELSDDAGAGSYQLCAVAPLGPHDRQQLLAADDATARLARLTELVADAVTLYELQLRMGGDTEPG